MSEPFGPFLLSKVLPTSTPAAVWFVVAVLAGGGQAFSFLLDYDKLEKRVEKVEESVGKVPPALSQIQTDLEWIKRELEKMPKVKVGVTFSSITPQALRVFAAADQIWTHLTGEVAVITSAEDGRHSPTSLHYQSAAWDLRIWPFLALDSAENGLSSSSTREAASLLRVFLGPDFDVVVEKTHIHVEFDPKPAPV